MKPNRFKFRIWDVNEKSMFNVIRIEWLSGILHVIHDGEQYVHISGADGAIVGDMFILMQSTGLVDSTGKEIFEGDILTIIQGPGKGDVVQAIWRQEPVKISSGGYTANPCYLEFQYKRIPFKDYHYDYGNLASWVGDKGTKIIGNIYENPELLEEE